MEYIKCPIWGLSKLKAGDSVTLSGATPSIPAAPEQISREFGKSL